MTPQDVWRSTPLRKPVNSLLDAPPSARNGRSPELAHEVFYPDSDGEPVAESPLHLRVMYAIFHALLGYLADREAMIFANQFLYYVEGNSHKRVAPDGMVILGVKIPGAKSYKIWETGIPPAIAFEITSQGTKKDDVQTKKDLYESLEIQEYWLYDPTGEWLPDRLRGYELVNGHYQPIAEPHSNVLGLSLYIDEDLLLGFVDDRTGEVLLSPEGDRRAKEAQRDRAERALQRAEQERLAKESEHERAEQERLAKESEHERAEQERLAKEAERQRRLVAEAEVERLRERLRQLEGDGG